MLSSSSLPVICQTLFAEKECLPIETLHSLLYKGMRLIHQCRSDLEPASASASPVDEGAPQAKLTIQAFYQALTEYQHLLRKHLSVEKFLAMEKLLKHFLGLDSEVKQSEPVSVSDLNRSLMLLNHLWLSGKQAMLQRIHAKAQTKLSDVPFIFQDSLRAALDTPPFTLKIDEFYRPGDNVHALKTLSALSGIGLRGVARTSKRVHGLSQKALSMKHFVLVAGGHHSLALSADGQVYSWGNGELGQLGHGDIDRRTTPTLIEALRDKCITQIAAGGSHTLAVTAKGSVYSWGSERHGQLGHGDVGCYYPSPTLIHALSDMCITQILAGCDHTLALAADGRVYSWGSGFHGQLGQGDDVSRTAPTLIEALSDKCVTKIVAGANHSLALTADGAVYSWGQGSSNQLGHGDDVSRTTPTLIEALEGKRIIQLAAGFDHTLALTADGEAYSWGNGFSGELGHGHTGRRQLRNPIPTVIAVLKGKRIQQIIANGGCSLALTAVGEVYSWGHEQVGHEDSACYFIPTLISGLEGKRIIQLAAGSGHALAITADGEVYSWGGGRYGQLGHGDTAYCHVPTQIDSRYLPTPQILKLQQEAPQAQPAGPSR